jgi:hypothetical protein
MTELSGYRPDQTPQGDLNENRFVFVDPNDRHGREFNITAAAAAQGRPIGGDTSEVNAMVEAAYREAEEGRNAAAARTMEQGAGDAELAQAIDWNAQAISATREDAEVNGL